MKKFKLLRSDLSEKTLTPAEKKKREEIAMAMERENPGMPMAKKMAIATATAKRVAEENIDELKTSTLDSYVTKVATGPSRGNTQTGIPKSIKAIGGVTTAIRKKAEQMKEAKEKSEYGYEGDMARGQLQSIIMNSQRVHDMLKDNDDLPEWVQSKITLAEDYISTVSNYMSSEVDEETEIKEEKPGLWANIHAKRKRIESGSGERMRKPGSKGAPSSQDFKDAAKTSKNEEFETVDEAISRAQQAAIAIAKKKKQGVAEESETELGDLAHATTLKHRFLVTYSDPKHTMASMRKEKQQKHVLVPSSTKNGETVYQGEAEPLVKKFMKNQGLKVHEVEHVGMVSKKVNEETLDEGNYTFKPASHTPTVKNSRGHSFEGNTYNAQGKKGASIYKHKDTGKYYADRISANTTFHSSAEEAAEKYHNKAK